MLLTEQEIRDIARSVKDIGENSDRALILAAQKAVIAKIKAQGPDMLYHGRCVVDCGEYGHPNVELLKLIPVGTKLYKLPSEGD